MYVHGLCLEEAHKLAKSSDSNLSAVHVEHLVRQGSNQTSLLETMYLMCRVKNLKSGLLEARAKPLHDL